VTSTSIIFDLDGTLIDSEPGVQESFAKAAEAIFPKVAFDPASVVIGPPLPKMFAATFPNATSEEVGALVKAFRADYIENGWKKTRIFDDVATTLKALGDCGYQMFVVTNKPLDISLKILRHFGFDTHFKEIMSLDSAAPPYANKTTMVRALVQQRHLKAEQCVLIGDTKGDAEAAGAMNIPFIWVSFGYGKRTEIPGSARMVDSFKELLSVLG
jgi:phosphoglycolate phosphatase